MATVISLGNWKRKRMSHEVVARGIVMIEIIPGGGKQS